MLVYTNVSIWEESFLEFPPPPNLFFFKVIRSLSKTLKKSSFGYKIDPVGVRVIMKIREKRRMTNKL